MAEASLGQLLTELVTDVGQLLRQELRLAQTEASEKLQQAQHGIYAVVTGLLIAFCALLILLQAVVIALSKAMPAWAASLSVGVVLALIALVLIRQGARSLRARNLIPERTLRAGRREAVEHHGPRGAQAGESGR